MVDPQDVLDRLESFEADLERVNQRVEERQRKRREKRKVTEKLAEIEATQQRNMQLVRRLAVANDAMYRSAEPNPTDKGNWLSDTLTTQQ